MTQRNIPEELSLQANRFESLTSCINTRSLH